MSMWKARRHYVIRNKYVVADSEQPYINTRYLTTDGVVGFVRNSVDITFNTMEEAEAALAVARITGAIHD